MEEIMSDTSFKGKTDYLRKLILIGKTAEAYCDDVKMIKMLGKQLTRQKKQLKRSRYPMIDSDKRDVSIAMTELKDILVRLAKMSEVERYKIAVQSLGEYVAKLEKTVFSEDEKSITKSVISAAKDTAKSLGEELSKGVEKLKKTAQDLGLK